MKKFRFVIVAFFFTTQQMLAQDLFMPPLNAQIIQFVNNNIGKQVGRGECWDLAAQALEFGKAQHPDTYIFGDELSTRETIYAGDIIQFENCRIETEGKDGQFVIISLEHHTAIIYDILGNGKYVIADQNNDFSGKKVGISTIDLSNVSSGSFKIFRPKL